MKKRILSALMALMVGISSAGAVSVMAENGDLILSETTKVEGENTEARFAKATDSEYHIFSNYYMHFKTGEDWLEVSQKLTENVVAGNQYVISVDAKPIQGQLWLRLGWDGDDGAWMMVDTDSSGTDLGNGWKRYEKVVTMNDNQSNIIIHNGVTTEVYFDNVSVKPVDGGKDLVPNGGFESITYDESKGTITPNLTTVNVENTETVFAKILSEEIPADNNYSLHFYTEGDWLEASQKYTVENLAAGAYTLTWYAKGEGRIWFYSNWNEGKAEGEFAATHAVDSAELQPDGWTKYTKVINIDGIGDTKILFHGEGVVDCYVDDISLVDANGINYVPDGGFSEVTIEGVDVDTGIPDDNLVLSSTTTVNANEENCYARVTDDEKSSGNYSLHFNTNGDWLEVSQTLTENTMTGETYMLSAYVKPVKGRVWFRLGWDDTAWMVADATLGTDWVKVEKEVTIAGNDNSGEINTILFHNEGETEFYIDDISLVKIGEETNRVPDGGFEETKLLACAGEHVWDEGVVTTPPTVDVEGIKTYTCTKCIATMTESIGKLPSGEPDEPEVPDEPEAPTIKLPDEWFELSSTTVSKENTADVFAKVTSKEKYEGNYSLHYKSDADHFEVSQTLTEKTMTGETYMLSAYVKPVKGRVWFRLGWDHDAWMVADAALGTDWVKVEKEVTIAGNDNGGEINTILFHNEGETEFYIDSVSLVKVGEETNRVPDGGFEDVKADVLDEYIVPSSTTVSKENTADVFAKVTGEEKYEGKYSMHYKSDADHFEVSQTLTEKTMTGETYMLSAYVKPVKGRVWFRLGWDDTAWMVADATLGTDWVKVEKEVTIAGNDNGGEINTILFHNEGETEFYIDNISLVKVGEDTERVPNGGFEDVGFNFPDEWLVPLSTTVSKENTADVFAKVTSEEKYEGNYSMYYKSDADHFEVSQTLEANALVGETYMLSAYVKPVKGRVWFRLGWDDTAWMAADATLGTDWVKVEKEVTVAGNEGDLNTILFHNEGETEFYIDNISLVKVGEDTERVPNGGFEAVTVITKAPHEHVWDEGKVTLEPTVDAEGEKTYTCTGCGETKTEAIEKLPAPSYILGDANGDNKVDIKDGIAIRRFITGGYNVTVNEAASNVNGDAKIDIKDVITIRRFITGGYGVELK